MASYQALYRKYRPQTFDDVSGQMAVTQTLKTQLITGKMSHAYLFTGSRGTGKTSCAKILAKAVNCEHPDGGNPCNRCAACKAIDDGTCMDVLEIDAASNNGVDNIRDLRDDAVYTPSQVKKRVYIIDEVHMLSTQAFNAFLKTLEEPPAHVIFILATTEKHKILPTILSRCQIYDFERMTVPGIVNHLKMVAEKEGIKYEEQALDVIAEKADGGMRDALSVFDQAASFCQGDITYAKVIEDLNVLDSDNYFRIVDLCLENKAADVMVLLNNVIAKGFDGGNLIGGLASHVRNVLMAKDVQTLPLLQASEAQTAKYKAQAQKCPTKFLYSALKILNECDINYRQSSNKRLLVEITLIRVAQITQPDDEGVAGRSPKRLKSLFKKLIASAQQNTAVQQVAAAASQAQRGERKTVRSETMPSPDNAGTAASDTGLAQAGARPQTPQKPVLKLGKIGKSFGNIMKGPEKPVYEAEPAVENTGLHEKFDDDMLLLQWMSMCNRMPDTMVGTAKRMKNLTPVITEFPDVEVVIDNKMLLEDVQKIKNRIRNTLVKALHNDDLQLSLRLAKPEEIKRILSPKELYSKLCKENEAIDKLGSMLDLEFA